MNRVVLDTSVVVSAALVPPGTQALVVLLALRRQVALYISKPILAKYEEAPKVGASQKLENHCGLAAQQPPAGCRARPDPEAGGAARLTAVAWIGST